MNAKEQDSFKFSIKIPQKQAEQVRTDPPRIKKKEAPKQLSKTPKLAKRGSISPMPVNKPKMDKSRATRNWFMKWVPVPSLNGLSTTVYTRRWVRLQENVPKEEQIQPAQEAPVKKEPKPQQSIFKCTFPDCDKAFTDAGSLKKHMVVHGEKQFICDFKDCGKKFLDKSKLKRHRLVHTGERPYKCEICGKKFSLDFNLRTHIRTHTGLKPYVCSFPNCGKRFTQSSNLAAHEKVHTKEKKEDGRRKPRTPKKPGEKGDASGEPKKRGRRSKKPSKLCRGILDSITDPEIKTLLLKQFNELRDEITYTGLGKVLLDK